LGTILLDILVNYYFHRAARSTALYLVALTQYFDTLQILGGDARSKVVFLPSNPGASGDFMNQIRVAFSSAMETQTDNPPIAHREPEKES